MATYVITIDRYKGHRDDGPPTGSIEIECHTNYTLLDDVPEWIQEEIDPDAVIVKLPDEGMTDNAD